MARNRIIKPEFWADAKVGRLSFGARLLYIATWNFADDYGIISASPRRLLGEAFENDEAVTLDDVRRFLAEIEQQGMIRSYRANDKDWYEIVHFDAHQKISHKSTRANPKPSGESPASLRQSTGSNVNVNGNVNGNGNENDNDNGAVAQKTHIPSTETADLLTMEGQLLVRASACFGSSPDVLTDNQKLILRQIRTDRRVGVDKFIRACENRARAPDSPGEIGVDFFLNKFEWMDRIIKWANGAPKYGQFNDKKPGRNYTARNADKGDGTGWDHLITVAKND